MPFFNDFLPSSSKFLLFERCFWSYTTVSRLFFFLNLKIKVDCGILLTWVKPCTYNYATTCRTLMFIDCTFTLKLNLVCFCQFLLWGCLKLWVLNFFHNFFFFRSVLFFCYCFVLCGLETLHHAEVLLLKVCQWIVILLQHRNDHIHMSYASVHSCRLHHY